MNHYSVHAAFGALFRQKRNAGGKHPKADQEFNKKHRQGQSFIRKRKELLK